MVSVASFLLPLADTKAALDKVHTLGGMLLGSMELEQGL